MGIILNKVKHNYNPNRLIYNVPSQVSTIEEYYNVINRTKIFNRSKFFPDDIINTIISFFKYSDNSIRYLMPWVFVSYDSDTKYKYCRVCRMKSYKWVQFCKFIHYCSYTCKIIDDIYNKIVIDNTILLSSNEYYVSKSDLMFSIPYCMVIYSYEYHKAYRYTINITRNSTLTNTIIKPIIPPDKVLIIFLYINQHWSSNINRSRYFPEYIPYNRYQLILLGHKNISDPGIILLCAVTAHDITKNLSNEEFILSYYILESFAIQLIT